MQYIYVNDETGQNAHIFTYIKTTIKISYTYKIHFWKYLLKTKISTTCNLRKTLKYIFYLNINLLFKSIELVT